MPFKTFSDDQVLTSADVNRYWVQQYSIIKSADETVVSSITLQSDDELFAPLLANTQYLFECFVIYDTIQAADFRVGWSIPAGASMDWVSNGLSTGATGTVGTIIKRHRSTGQDDVVGGPAAASGTNAIAPLEGRITTGATAGNMIFQWAQANSNATGAIVKANSALIIQRLTV